MSLSFRGPLKKKEKKEKEKKNRAESHSYHVPILMRNLTDAEIGWKHIHTSVELGTRQNAIRVDVAS